MNILLCNVLFLVLFLVCWGHLNVTIPWDIYLLIRNLWLILWWLKEFLFIKNKKICCELFCKSNISVKDVVILMGYCNRYAERLDSFTLSMYSFLYGGISIALIPCKFLLFILLNIYSYYIYKTIYRNCSTKMKAES